MTWSANLASSVKQAQMHNKLRRCLKPMFQVHPKGLLITQCLSSYNSGYCCYYYYYYFTKPSRWQFENLCRKSEPVRIRAGTSNQSTPTTQREEEEEEDDDDNDDNDDVDDDDDNFFSKIFFFKIFFQKFFFSNFFFQKKNLKFFFR